MRCRQWHSLSKLVLLLVMAMPRWCGAFPVTAPTSKTLTYRPGHEADKPFIQSTLFSLKMNFLLLDPKNFIVAVDPEEDAGDQTCSADPVGFGQIRPLNQRDFELASVYVCEEARGRGVGSAIVTALLRQHAARHGGGALPRTFLLTLADTTRFYERLGFRAADTAALPLTMRLELLAGSAIQALLGGRLVAMQFGGGAADDDDDGSSSGAPT
eukprot:TRINITY_DN4571_c0_g1_i1.p2 TRINITY_DN4571_c0_g1~~TRINITY_DN4571_c0_g1_i1.p2  ORF type:complete len:213 (-),score=61.43 TRINITY_DN4571_c0_g1_i1:416-1054(-)